MRPLLRATTPKPGEADKTRRQPGGRRQAIAALRAERALALYVEKGLTYAEIGRELGLSRQRVQQIITSALDEARERTGELSEFAFERALGSIDSVIREAAEILLRRCDECGGDEERRVLCWTCEKTGYFYAVKARFAAVDRLGRNHDRRMKLLGLVAAARAQPTPTGDRALYEALEALSDEELDAELNKLIGRSGGAEVTPDTDPSSM